MLGWFQALMPREDKFFDLFARAFAHRGRPAPKHCRNFWPVAKASSCHGREIIDLENQADAITAKVLTAVHKSFITPFDRGDIKDLIQSMDDAIDMMRKTVKTVTPSSRESSTRKCRKWAR